MKIIPRDKIKHLEWNEKNKLNNDKSSAISNMTESNPWKYVKVDDISNNPYLNSDSSIKGDIMSDKNIPVNIENAESIEINIFNSQSVSNSSKEVSTSLNALKSATGTPDGKTKFHTIVENIGKVVSILSGLAILIFVILLWLGIATIGEIQITKMFTVFSFTLFSSLISIGGVRLFTLSASLRKANEKIENYILENGGCPFYYVVDDAAKLRYQITSAYKINDKNWCNGCHLIDHNGNSECKLSH